MASISFRNGARCCAPWKANTNHVKCLGDVGKPSPSSLPGQWPTERPTQLLRCWSPSLWSPRAESGLFATFGSLDKPQVWYYEMTWSKSFNNTSSGNRFKIVITLNMIIESALKNLLRLWPWQWNIEGMESTNSEVHSTESLGKCRRPSRTWTWPEQYLRQLRSESAAANLRCYGSLLLWSIRPWWKELRASRKPVPCLQYLRTWAPVQGEKGAKAPNRKMRCAWVKNPGV